MLMPDGGFMFMLTIPKGLALAGDTAANWDMLAIAAAAAAGLMFCLKGKDGRLEACWSWWRPCPWCCWCCCRRAARCGLKVFSLYVPPEPSRPRRWLKMVGKGEDITRIHILNLYAHVYLQERNVKQHQSLCA